MGAMMRAFDWESSGLGPVSSWPTSLKTMVGVVLGNRFPMLLWWGPELLHLYNDGYRPILGDKHPAALAAPGQQVWSEVWDILGVMAESVYRGGPATWSEHLHLPMNRKGFVEETYFTFSYSPVPDDAGQVGGVLVTVQETTSQVQQDRQLRTLRDLAAHASAAKTMEQACTAAASTLSENDADVPFALLYLTSQDGNRAHLVSAAGMTIDAAGAIEAVSLADQTQCWPLGEVARTRLPKTVDGLGECIGLLPRGRWHAPPNKARVLPLIRPGLPRPDGFLVLGLNPTRLLDERYLGFFDLVADQLVGAFANADAYQEERRRAEALAKLDQAKTAFFSNVSHEFRTPLTLILGPARELLSGAEGPLSPAATAQVARIHDNARRLQRLVNVLLEFSRLEAGRVEATFEPTELGPLTADLASGFRSLIESAGMRLEVDCRVPLGSESFDGVAWVDPSMWEKIVLNLLSNAFKFTLEGTISVRLRALAERFVLEVEDTGVGIAPEEVPRLFERFHRIEASRARTFEGSGIGLALVDELVRMHHGTIDVSSQLERGTTFTVTIPRGHAHLPEAQVKMVRCPRRDLEGVAGYVAEASRWLGDDGLSPDEHDVPAASGAAEAPSATTSDGGPRPARILLADDNADMRAYVARILREHWAVDVVADGRAALDRAFSSPPDLVLTDVMMPGLDGLNLLRALREDPRTRFVPVILFSARAGEEARIDGINRGAADYLVKPFSGRELLSRVRSHLAAAAGAAEARAMRRRLQGYFSEAPAAIALVRGAEHVYELANRRWQALLGRPSTEILGSSARQLSDGGASSPRLLDILDEVYATERPVVVDELPWALDRGRGQREEAFLMLTCQPLREPDGILSSMMVAIDVTTQVRARKEVERLAVSEQRARALAEEADRHKDEFLAMLAHELRNPLAPIVTALEILKRRYPDDRHLTMIGRQSDNLIRIVDDLLDVARITRGKVELRREYVDVTKALSRSIDSTRTLFERRKHHLNVTLPPAQTYVFADPVRLDQILVNLLTNAAKYTEAGGQVTITAELGAGVVELRVLDNGIGMSAEVLGRVFTLFEQGPSDLARASGGLGIGLTIAKSLVELHGGQIRARSEGVGKGSEFVVQLPVVSQPPMQADFVGSPRPAPATESLRVMIVDDNLDAAEVLADLLTQMGHVVRVASDGTAALDQLQADPVDVVFLDIGLPFMDGYEVARRIQKLGPKIPKLVALTGYGQSEDRRRSVDAGFSYHMVKPPQMYALESVLEGIVPAEGRSIGEHSS